MRTMTSTFAAALFAVAGLGVPPAFPQQVDDPVAACDRQAASPYDPAVASGAGVALADIDALAAIATCEKAVAAKPDNARERFQLARAYDAAEQFGPAIENYRAAADAGYPLALSSLGSLYEAGLGVDADPAEAAKLYQQAADAGVVLAMENLGKLYEEGRGVPQDHVKAGDLYRRAAQKGSAYAAGSLGWLAENGFGVKQDEAEAVRLYRVAAEGGEAFAQFNLGVMSQQGRGGLTQSYADAIKYYEQAAEQHWPAAYLNLGLLYGDGTGVAKDIAKAEQYFRLAIAEGEPQLQGEARNALAWMLATEVIRLDEAETLSREAVASGPDNANWIDTLGWVLHLAGRNEEALPLAQRAVDLDPGNRSLADHLAQIRASLSG